MEGTVGDCAASEWRCILTILILVIVLKCTEMHQIVFCVTGGNVVSQANCTSQTNKLVEKEIRFAVTGGGGPEKGN